MCKYRYKNDRCANGTIESSACLGEDVCSKADVARRQSYRGDCSKEPWYGLYCAKYHHFYCPGMEHCSSAEAYFGSLVRFRIGVH